MAFPQDQRRDLLTQPRLGTVVVERLESAGFHSVESLRAAGVQAVVRAVCARAGSTAWLNRSRALEEAIARWNSAALR